MKNKLLPVLLIGCIVAGMMFSGCDKILGSYVVTGSGTLTTREYDITDFSRIVAGPSVELSIIRGDNHSLAITADNNIIDDFEIRKSGETLYIGMKNLYKFVNASQKATISLPDMSYLELTGVSRGTISGFNFKHPWQVKITGASSLGLSDMTGGNVSLEVSGASRLTGTIQMNDVDINVSGLSKIQLTGSGNDLNLDLSGASNADLSSWTAVDAEVKVSGACEADVSLSGHLNGEVSGASRVYYTGQTVIGNVRTSGGSSLTKR